MCIRIHFLFFHYDSNCNLFRTNFICRAILSSPKAFPFSIIIHATPFWTDNFEFIFAIFAGIHFIIISANNGRRAQFVLRILMKPYIIIKIIITIEKHWHFTRSEGFSDQECIYEIVKKFNGFTFELIQNEFPWFCLHSFELQLRWNTEMCSWKRNSILLVISSSNALPEWNE